MTTTLEDTNVSPLGTITFSPDTDTISLGCSRDTEKGERTYIYSNVTTQGHVDLKTSLFKLSINIAVKDSATINLLTNYFLKQNVTGYRLTIPNKPTAVAPFNTSYLMVTMDSFNYVDIGGTEKPYYLVTLLFRIVDFV